MISDKEKPMNFDGFYTEHDSRDTSKLSAILFQTIPGYDTLEEYGPETRELWADVRVQVDDYFEQRSA